MLLPSYEIPFPYTDIILSVTPSNVTETEGYVEVCVRLLSSPSIESRNISLMTQDGTAIGEPPMVHACNHQVVVVSILKSHIANSQVRSVRIICLPSYTMN